MKIEDFGPFTLSKGAHSDPSDGMCIMEMVSFLAGEPWGYQPDCACPAITAYAHTLNDRAPQSVRDQLQSRVPLLIGTRDPGAEGRRAEHFAWSAVTIFAPAALRRDGLHDAAARLAGLDRSVGMEAASAAAVQRWTDGRVRTAAAMSAASAAAMIAAGMIAAESATWIAPVSAAHAAARSAAHADAWDDALRVLDEAIALGDHGQSLPDLAERCHDLKDAMEPIQ